MNYKMASISPSKRRGEKRKPHPQPLSKERGARE